MFIRPTENEKADFDPTWHVICAPGFKADPAVDGTRQSNFAILNFTRILVNFFRKGSKSKSMTTFPLNRASHWPIRTITH
jgi:ATP-dependent phosphoenolpyruvate carboxykinase